MGLVVALLVVTAHLVLHHRQVLQLHLAVDPLPGVDEDAGPVLHEVDDVPRVRQEVLVVFSGIVSKRVPDVSVQDVHFTLLKQKSSLQLLSSHQTSNFGNFSNFR